jgi:hypothetical protein
VNQVFDVEIGRADDPTAIVTTRAHAPFGSLGSTCDRTQGPAMAAQCMAQLVRRDAPEPGFANRRFLPWPTRPDRYRVTVVESDGAEGPVAVTVEAEDGRRVTETVAGRDTFGATADIMQGMRREIGDPAWDEGAVMRRALAGNLRPVPETEGPGSTLRGGGWPEDEVLPLDPDECVALVEGRGVVPRRPLTRD